MTYHTMTYPKFSWHIAWHIACHQDMSLYMSWMSWLAKLYVMVTHVICHWAYVMGYVMPWICHEHMSWWSLCVIGYVIKVNVMRICHKYWYICHQNTDICHRSVRICHYALMSSGHVMYMLACVIENQLYVIEIRSMDLM